MSDTDDISTHSGRAAGLSFFGGIVLATVGMFQVLQGLSAVLNDNVFVPTRNYVFELDLTVWGWIHLAVGLIAVPVGVAIVASRPWGFFSGIVLAVLSMLTQFVFVPYYPLWALTIIAFDVAVIWALCIR
ncbi:MAG: DUF7144 family membrane protein, partial [Nocardioidaceae bacterium]